MVAIFGGFKAEFSGPVILPARKTKSSTDRCRDRWSWAVLGQIFGESLGLCRYLAAHTAEVTVIVKHITLVAL